MAFKIDHAQLKEEQLARTLAEGAYAFEIISAVEKDNAKSSNGKMIALSLAVFDGDGRKHLVKDWLGAWNYGLIKIQALAESVGLLDEFIAGEIEAEMLVGLSGEVHTKIGEYNGKPQASVSWYIPAVSDSMKAKYAPRPKVAKTAGTEVIDAAEVNDANEDLPF